MTPDARLSALHRGVYGDRSRAGCRLDASVFGVTVCDISRPLVVAEGGFPEPPGARLRATRAGRRIPLRLWLVSGDALGERERRH